MFVKLCVLIEHLYKQNVTCDVTNQNLTPRSNMLPQGQILWCTKLHESGQAVSEYCKMDVQE